MDRGNNALLFSDFKQCFPNAQEMQKQIKLSKTRVCISVQKGESEMLLHPYTDKCAKLSCEWRSVSQCVSCSKLLNSLEKWQNIL